MRRWERIVKKEPTEINIKNYNIARNKFKRTCKKYKEESWSQFCDSLNNKTSIKEVWSKIIAVQGVPPREIPILGKKGEGRTNTEKAEIFAQQFQKASSSKN